MSHTRLEDEPNPSINGPSSAQDQQEEEQLTVMSFWKLIVLVGMHATLLYAMNPLTADRTY